MHTAHRDGDTPGSTDPANEDPRTAKVDGACVAVIG